MLFDKTSKLLSDVGLYCTCLRYTLELSLWWWICCLAARGSFLSTDQREKALLSKGYFNSVLPVCRFGVWEGALRALLQYMVRVEWVLLQECRAARHIMWATQTRGTPLQTLTRLLQTLTERSFWTIWRLIRGPLENVLGELGIRLGRWSSARVKGSFIPTVCKELATLACWSKVSDLSLSDGTNLIMQCLLRTAPLCLLFYSCVLLALSIACSVCALQISMLTYLTNLQQCWQGFF